MPLKVVLSAGVRGFGGFTLPQNARKGRLNRFCGVFWLVPYPRTVFLLKHRKRPHNEPWRQRSAGVRLKGLTLCPLFGG